MLAYVGIAHQPASMTRPIKAIDSCRALSALASASLLLLASCSQPSGSDKSASPEVAPEASTSNLLTALPSPYSDWKEAQAIGSCSVEPATPSADGSLTIRGWGVINASAGEVPEAAIFTVQMNGIDRFLVADLEDRSDVATRLNNSKLLQSGFTAQLPASEVKLPITITMRLGFQNKLFACKHKLDVR